MILFWFIYEVDKYVYLYSRNLQTWIAQQFAKVSPFFRRSWILITQTTFRPQTALRKPLSRCPGRKRVSLGRCHQKPIGRCGYLKTHHNYHESPHAPRPPLIPFHARVEYEAVGFPCIRYERFYLWPPAPGPDELWYCFGRFSESTRSVTRINCGGEI